MRNILYKHSLLWILMAIIVLTGILTVIVSVSDFYHSASNNHQITGDAKYIRYPGFDAKHFKSHEFQHYAENLIERKLRLRNFFIGVNSQIYYSLFKKSFAEDSQVIVGKHHQLFEMYYITGYCHTEKQKLSQLTDWANKIRILSDFFESKGKTFIYLMTPSKAEYMPEAIPDRFHCQNVGISQHIKLMEKLLNERGVRTVNAPTLMVTATQKYGIPMFPQGGIHWNWLGTAIGANAVINAINQDGRVRVTPLRFNYAMKKMNPQDADDDLLSLIKLLKPHVDYTVPQLDFLNLPTQPSPIKLAIVGGSFNENLIKVFVKNKTFSEIHFYFYFNSHKFFSALNEKPITLDIDTKSATALAPIMSSDVIIFEENSSLTVSHHGKRFYEAMHTGGLLG